MSQNRAAILLAMVIVATIGHESTADVTGIKLDTTKLPPVIGDPVAFAPTYGPPYSGPITSFLWELKHAYNGCVREWQQVGTNENLNFSNGGGAYTLPGKYEFRLTVTYGQFSGGGPPPPPQAFVKFINIGQVDGARIVDDAQGEQRQYTTAKPLPGSTFIIRFQMTSGGKDCGPYFSGQVQERLVNIIHMGAHLFDEDWGGIAAYFYRQGSLLIDHKFAYGDDRFSLLPVNPNAPFATYTQYLRVVFFDNCGNRHESPEIGPFYVKHHKVGPMDYDVNISELPPLP